MYVVSYYYNIYVYVYEQKILMGLTHTHTKHAS